MFLMLVMIIDIPLRHNSGHCGTNALFLLMMAGRFPKLSLGVINYFINKERRLVSRKK